MKIAYGCPIGYTGKQEKGEKKVEPKEFKISLAAARVNAGLTQGEVAKKMGVTRQTIVNYEKGKIIPGIPQLDMLCGMYNVPSDYIFLPDKST